MRTYLQSLFELSKFRLSSLVIITFAIGSFLSPAYQFDLNFLGALLGVTLLVAAANMFNCIWERDVDLYMERTAKRPLVTGAMSLRSAVISAFITLILASLLLKQFSNTLTLGLGFLAFFTYVFLYTPLKRISMTALFVGAIPGALPPVMGWTHVESSLNSTALILFWILFLWQLPHFISIALFRKEEYAKAGLKTVAESLGVTAAKRHMILYAVFLLLISLAPFIVGEAGSIYVFTALLSGLVMLSLTILSLKELQEVRFTRWVFWSSIIYLPVLLGIWVLEAFLRSSP